MTVKDNTIIVDVNGVLVVAIGNLGSIHVQSHNKEYVKQTKHNMEHVTHVPLISGKPHERYPTGSNTYLEVIASIVAINWGQAVIVEAPKEVMDALNKQNHSVQFSN